MTLLGTMICRANELISKPRRLNKNVEQFHEDRGHFIRVPELDDFPPFSFANVASLSIKLEKVIIITLSEHGALPVQVVPYSLLIGHISR